MIQTWDILGLIACLVTPVVKSFEPSLGLSLPSQTFHPGVKSFHPRVGELKSMLRPSPTSEVARPIQNFKVFLKSFFGSVLLLTCGGSFHQARRQLARRPVLEDDDMNEAKVMLVCVCFISFPYSHKV